MAGNSGVNEGKTGVSTGVGKVSRRVLTVVPTIMLGHRPH